MMRMLSHMQRDYAWYNQERMKGNMLPGCGRSEGGWGFNREYLVPFGEFVGQQGMVVYEWRPPSPALIAQITDDARISPVFRPFEDETLHTTNFVASISRELRSQLLADAIPAESLPVGSSVVPRWGESSEDGGEHIRLRNVDMSALFKDVGHISFFGDGDDREWGHSFFLSAPFMTVHSLFEDIVLQMKGENK